MGYEKVMYKQQNKETSDKVTLATARELAKEIQQMSIQRNNARLLWIANGSKVKSLSSKIEPKQRQLNEMLL